MCPYRHEKIDEEDMESLKKGVNIDERIRERFHGVNDPVAKRILDRVKETEVPPEPEDPNITTVFIGGIEETMGLSEEGLREKFEAYGKVKAVKIIQKQGLAFVCFFAREAAIKAVELLHERFFVGEKRLKVLWAKSQLEQSSHHHH